MARRVVTDPTYTGVRAYMVGTLADPMHVKLDAAFKGLLQKKAAKESNKKRAKGIATPGGKSSGARAHDCATDGCAVLGHINPSTFQSIDGFENELPVNTCREKFISDAVDNVDMIVRAVSAISPLDLDIDAEHVVGLPAPTPERAARSSRAAQRGGGGGEAADEQSANDASVLEIPTIMNAADAIAERRQKCREFLETLDDCGLVAVAYKPHLADSALKRIRKTVTPGAAAVATLDARAITSMLSEDEALIPVRILHPRDGVFTYHFCAVTHSKTWSFRPTSVAACELARLKYTFDVYRPRTGLAGWAPELRSASSGAGAAGSNGGIGSTGDGGAGPRPSLLAAGGAAAAAVLSPLGGLAGTTSHANAIGAGVSAESFMFRTPKHLVYPRYAEYAQAVVDARRARSMGSYPLIVTETKHDMKQVEHMTELERNMRGHVEAQRERAILENRRMTMSAVSNVMNPLLGTQLVPGSLVSVSVHFAEQEYRRRLGDMEDENPDERMTAYYNSASEATAQAAATGRYLQPLSARGVGLTAMINPTAGEPVTELSKRPRDNSYAMLSAMMQQSSNVPVLAQARLNKHVLPLPRESKVAHVSMPSYVGESETHLYETFRKSVLEAYKVPPSVLQTGQQGQWGMSRAIPLFGAFSRNIVAATFNMESRGYGEFISRVHEELQQFFLWMYRRCLAHLDARLLETIFDHELRVSKKAHDALVRLVEEYKRAWKDVQVAAEEQARLRTAAESVKRDQSARRARAGPGASARSAEAAFDDAEEAELQAQQDQLQTDYMKKEALALSIQRRVFLSHRDYAQLTQYLYFLTLAAQGTTSIKFEFMPTKRYMDNVETERLNFEYQHALTSGRLRDGSGGSAKGIGSGGGSNA